MSDYSWPRYVRCTDFWSRQHEKTKLGNHLHMVNLYTGVAMILTPGLGIVMASFMEWLNGDAWAGNVWLAVLGACAALIIVANAVRRNALWTTNKLIDEIDNHSFANEELWERMAFFDDKQSMWNKILSEGRSPREDVYQWCKSNEVKATIAHYDDYFMGHLGLYISFPDDESEMLFKLKYLDKI